MLGKVIKKSWAIDENGSKLDDPTDPSREGVHYIYADGTEATIYNTYVLNPDGTRETKSDKFLRLYGRSDYDNTQSWSWNVYNKAK